MSFYIIFLSIKIYPASAQTCTIYIKQGNMIHNEYRNWDIYCPTCEDTVTVCSEMVDDNIRRVLNSSKFIKYYLIYNQRNQFVSYYVGDLLDGKREGLGFSINRNGVCFWGKRKNDKMENGTLYYSESDSLNRKKLVASYIN